MMSGKVALAQHILLVLRRDRAGLQGSSPETRLQNGGSQRWIAERDEIISG
jgi:hypothetical protein